MSDTVSSAAVVVALWPPCYRPLTALTGPAQDSASHPMAPPFITGPAPCPAAHPLPLTQTPVMAALLIDCAPIKESSLLILPSI